MSRSIGVLLPATELARPLFPCSSIWNSSPEICDTKSRSGSASIDTGATEAIVSISHPSWNIGSEKSLLLAETSRQNKSGDNPPFLDLLLKDFLDMEMEGHCT